MTTSQTPSSAVAYLCRAFGETDHTIAEIVPDMESVRRFIVEFWLGDPGASDLPEIMKSVQDEIADKGEYSVAFEIGGLSVEPVAAISAPAEQQAKVPARRSTGYVAPKGRYVPPVLFSPYTGEPRDARDIQSDPHGVLIWPPGAELLAAISAPAAEQQAPVMVVAMDEGAREPRIVSWNKLPRGETWLYATENMEKCPLCKGSGVVDDGEINHYSNGAPYENGPVKCVKDCPQCEGAKVIRVAAPVVQAAEQPDEIVAVEATAEAMADLGRALMRSVDDHIEDAIIDSICQPDRAKRWHGDGRQYDRDTVRLVLDHLREAAEQQAGVPIDMVLHCPACGLQHVDKPEGQFIPGFTADETVAHNKHYGLWDNPPHRSHLCKPAAGGCGHIWRPADVPTNGVQAVKTTGKADSPVAHRAQQAGAPGDYPAIPQGYHASQFEKDEPVFDAADMRAYADATAAHRAQQAGAGLSELDCYLWIKEGGKGGGYEIWKEGVRRGLAATADALRAKGTEQ